VDEISIREVDPITYLKKRSAFTSTA